jgi:hypothetical protein
MQLGKLLKFKLPRGVDVVPLHVVTVAPGPIFVIVGTHTLIVLSSPVLIYKLSVFGLTVIKILVVSHTPLLHMMIHAVSLPT